MKIGQRVLKWNLRVPNLQMSFRELTINIQMGNQDRNLSNIHQADTPFCGFLNEEGSPKLTFFHHKEPRTVWLILGLFFTSLVKRTIRWNTLRMYLQFYSKFMMMSSNGNIFHVTGHLCWELTGPRIHRSPVNSPTRSFDIFFDMHLNKRLSKQSWGWWFETLLHPLWRHCNV